MPILPSLLPENYMACMVRAIMFLIVVIPFSGKGQVSNNEASTGYFTAAGEVFFSNDDGKDFLGESFGAGVIFQKTVSLGAEVGFYKIKHFKNGVFPVGGQIGISSFNAKKVAPILNLGVYYPFYRESTSTSPSAASGAVHVTVETKGEVQFKAQGGVLFRASRKLRIIATGGYNTAKFRSKLSSRFITTGPNNTTISYEAFKVESWIVSLSFMLN